MRITKHGRKKVKKTKLKETLARVLNEPDEDSNPLHTAQVLKATALCSDKRGYVEATGDELFELVSKNPNLFSTPQILRDAFGGICGRRILKTIVRTAPPDGRITVWGAQVLCSNDIIRVEGHAFQMTCAGCGHVFTVTKDNRCLSCPNCALETELEARQVDLGSEHPPLALRCCVLEATEETKAALQRFADLVIVVGVTSHVEPGSEEAKN